MSNSPADDERLDHDQTDELPVLLDTADLESEMDVAGSEAEPTGEHTSHLVALSDSNEDALRSELDLRIKQIAALERDLARLSSRWLDTERYLTEKDAVIRDLNRALAKARVEVAERRTTEQSLATELADREGQFGKLLDEIDRMREEAAAREREIEHQRTGRQAAVEALAVARLELAHRSSPVSEDDEIQVLREELATLSVYIDNRRASWAANEERVAEQQQRIAELERELAHRAERQQRAEELAERENSRALAMREELVAQSRQTESLAAELTQYRAFPVAQRAAIASLEAELATAWQAHERLQQELAEARAALTAKRGVEVPEEHHVDLPMPKARANSPEPAISVRDRSSTTKGRASGEAPATSGASSGGAETSMSAARDETELERKRLQLEVQRETVRELERQRATAVGQGETAQRLAVEAQADLEDARAGTARIERTVVDKSRPLALQDDGIATLQAELDQKHAVQPLEGRTDPALKRLDAKVAEHEKRGETPVDRPNTPTLICLTSDAPRQYTLTKRVTTIGRSAQCDIQIVTHFVSREHARISIAQRGGVVIEDLASTNGVFVNSLRVERQELRHGDLVTVGETQFRFLESMAH